LTDCGSYRGACAPYNINDIRIKNATQGYYTTLQEGYNSAVNGDIIQSPAIVITGDLNINRNISITFEGGYDCFYSTQVGYSTLKGDITLSNGTVIFENFILK
jgi:hypothetical protein